MKFLATLAGIFDFADLIFQTRILQAKNPVQTWKKSSWIFQTGELEKASADRYGEKDNDVALHAYLLLLGPFMC